VVRNQVADQVCDLDSAMSLQLTCQNLHIIWFSVTLELMLKCNTEPNDLEVLASDRDTWKSVCDAGLMKDWITASVVRRANHHAASTRPKTVRSTMQQSLYVPPSSDYGATCGLMPSPATQTVQRPSSSNFDGLQQQRQQRQQLIYVAGAN